MDCAGSVLLSSFDSPAVLLRKVATLFKSGSVAEV